MPVKHCIINGEPGFKWGDRGVCYPEKEDGYEKAVAQGYAIEKSGGEKVKEVTKNDADG